MHQLKYISDLVNKAQLTDSKPTSTPVTTSKILSKFNGELLNETWAT